MLIAVIRTTLLSDLAERGSIHPCEIYHLTCKNHPKNICRIYRPDLTNFRPPGGGASMWRAGGCGVDQTSIT
jgi:hypothetical protein